MGIFSKLAFWKREEAAPLELGQYPALEAGPPSARMPEFGPSGGPGLTEMPAEPFGGPMPHLAELGPAPSPPMGMRAPLAPSAFAPAPVAPPADMTRDMQVVQAKLDTLKALLDNINAKLDRLERSQPPREEAETIPLSVRRWR